MPRYTFEEISVKGIKRWKDEAGKTRQQTKKFYQTVNPFNKNAAGIQKSRDEIWAEVIADRDAWLAQPTA